ncbi:MAG: GTP cyclohydrolase I FolE2 [Thermoplasmatales archaeon]|nr:GTP cyclohydrolase I FolE2 [Thermoplasmatales archaeon]
MNPTCDVQGRRIDAGFKLSRVGVTGVKKQIRIKRSAKDNGINGVLTCDIDVFVDLPAVQKGSHLSRNLEVIAEIVDESVRSPTDGIENLAAEICSKLLSRHDYAHTADVSITADYFRSAVTPNGRDTVESYGLIGEASCVRGRPIRKTLGITVVGMTACPCAQETVVGITGYGGNIPAMSHNQRNVCTLMLSMDEGVEVEADDLIDLVEKSFSSPTFELLKRDDEAAVVMNAHSNPKFVEDVVRDVLRRLVEGYPDLPDDIGVLVSSESEESIHKHNAFAERYATLGELRS